MRDKVEDAVRHVCEELYYSRDDILRMLDDPAMRRGDNRYVMLAALAWHLRAMSVRLRFLPSCSR
jgi:hypothetical protein